MRITSLLLALTAVARSADPSVPHIHSGAFKQYQHAKPSKYGLSAGRVPKSERYVTILLPVDGGQAFEWVSRP